MQRIKGYHAHVYYDAATMEQARELCEEAARMFPVTMGRMHRPGGTQALVRSQHRLHGDGLVVVVGHRIHAGDRTAMNDHLGTGNQVRKK